MPQVQEFKKPEAATAGLHGHDLHRTRACTKCTDSKVEYIEHISSAGDAFPNFPGGNGKGKGHWYPAHLSQLTAPEQASMQSR